MKRVKILVTAGDFRHYLSPFLHYFLEELSKITDLTVWHKSGDIHDILKQLKIKPDFIFITEHGETNSPKITGLHSLKIPFAVSFHDLHYKVEARKNLVRKGNIKYIFSHYRDKFFLWYPEFSDKLRWLPHHVNTNIFKDYGLKKNTNWLLMGAVHKDIYPLRTMMLHTMKNMKGFVYHPHPGYRHFQQKDKAFIGARYAKEINKAKMFLTCDSKYKYPLAKYFEVLASKSLLLAPASKELRELGFIPGVHYVAVNKNNYKAKAIYYLKHEKERKKITEQGYRMVHARHSTKKRAREFLKMVNDILAKS